MAGPGAAGRLGCFDRRHRVVSPSHAQLKPINGQMVHLTCQWKAGYSIGVANRERGKADVLQGTLDLMVLQTLASLGPSHGYSVASRLEQVSSGALRLNMGTLYPALMRLEQRGWLKGTWGLTDNNRRARFYALTPAGRRQLASEKTEWERMVAIMYTLLHEQG
jgi:PadR family transcriptional regulator, regulatory protein PadR